MSDYKKAAKLIGQWAKEAKDQEDELVALRARVEKLEKVVDAVNHANWLEHIEGGYVLSHRDAVRIMKATDNCRDGNASNG